MYRNKVFITSHLIQIELLKKKHIFLWKDSELLQTSKRKNIWIILCFLLFRWNIYSFYSYWVWLSNSRFTFKSIFKIEFKYYLSFSFIGLWVSNFFLNNVYFAGIQIFSYTYFWIYILIKIIFLKRLIFLITVRIYLTEYCNIHIYFKNI